MRHALPTTSKLVLCAVTRMQLGSIGHAFSSLPSVLTWDFHAQPTSAQQRMLHFQHAQPSCALAVHMPPAGDDDASSRSW